MDGLRISEVARRTGLPASTIRFYESEGLIEPARRDANGYRSYSAHEVDRLRLLADAKRLGLGLAQVRHVLAARAESQRCEHAQAELLAVIADQLEATRTRIEELQRLAGELQATAVHVRSATIRDACSDSCVAAALTGASGPASAR